MASTKICTFNDLLSAIEEGRATALAFTDYPSPTADFVGGDEDMPIPKLHFTWVVKQSVALDPADEEVAEGMGMAVSPAHNGGKPYVWWMAIQSGEAVREHSWSMNFRRYGWSATRRPAGETGYGQAAVIWANALDGGLDCYDSRTVVRDTLIRHMAELRVPRELVYHVGVRPLWRKLLVDALDHYRDDNHTGVPWASHPVAYAARKGNGNGAIGDVVIDGAPYDWASDL